MLTLTQVQTPCPLCPASYRFFSSNFCASCFCCISSRARCSKCHAVEAVLLVVDELFPDRPPALFGLCRSGRVRVGESYCPPSYTWTVSRNKPTLCSEGGLQHPERTSL